MTTEKIKIEDAIKNTLEVDRFDFPKYTTQIINLANQNSQGTRPNTVGQLSELINDIPEKTYAGWKDFYLKNHGHKLNEATDKTWEMIQSLKKAINLIDKEMVRNWVYDLVINKTAEGLIIQEIILRHLSDKFNKPYKLANPEEESKGIDGYIKNIPIQIKPKSYSASTTVKNQNIKVFTIFYSKTDKYLTIEYEDNLNKLLEEEK